MSSICNTATAPAFRAPPNDGIRAQKLDVKLVEPLSDEEIKALLKARGGKDLRDRHNAAIIRLMVETVACAGEVAALQVSDIDLRKARRLRSRSSICTGCGTPRPIGGWSPAAPRPA